MRWLKHSVALGCGFLWAVHASAAATVPATQRVDGTISASQGKTPIVAAQNDKILVLNASKGGLEAVGSVVDGNGTYFVLVAKDSTFANTPLTLQLQKSDNSTYQLLAGNGQPATFNFSGGLFPVRLNLSLAIGGSVGDVPAAAGAPAPAPTAPTTSQCANPRMDVNGDGTCDQRDIEIIKAYLAGSTHTVATARKEDVNGDGVVNSRDLIDAIRSVRGTAGAPGRAAP